MIVLRLTILGVALVGCLVWILFASIIRRPAYSLAAFLFLGNVVTFQAIRIFAPGAISISTLNTWALAIQLQAVLTLLIFGVFLFRWMLHERG